MTKEDLINEMKAGREEWEEYISRFSTEQLEAPIAEGKWSMKQVIAHIAGYEEYAAAMIKDTIEKSEENTLRLDDKYQLVLEEMRASNPELPESIHETDHNLLNAIFVESRKSFSPSETIANEKKAYNKLLKQVESAPEKELTATPKSLMGKSLIDILPNQCYGHYKMHMGS